MNVRRTYEPTQALIVTRNGGPEVLELAQRDVGEPGPGELLVRVAAAGVNFIDVHRRKGTYPMPTPFVVGDEGAGRVEALGSQVSGVAVGDLVAWARCPGSAAGLAIIEAHKAVPVPAGVPAETAAAAMLQGLTAHFLVNSSYPVQTGDVVLVHAAAGGVGQLLTQLAKARGAVVIATVSTEAKAAKARAAGADHVINYSEITDVAAAVRELTGGVGVAAAYDGVGKNTFDSSLDSLRIRGTLVLFGAASGQVPPFDLQRLNSSGSLYVTRPTLAHYVRSREELLYRSEEVLEAIAARTLSVEIGGRYRLAEAARAYQDLEGRRSTGKLLLIP
jgi:NADPH2:quinone reductase